MTRHVTDMLRDACQELDRALLVVGAYRHDPVQVGRGFDLGFLAHSDLAALVQDVAQLEAERDNLEADNDRLRKALRAVTRERDEWRDKAHGAACDDNLGPLLAASLEGSR